MWVCALVGCGSGVASFGGGGEGGSGGDGGRRPSSGAGYTPISVSVSSSGGSPSTGVGGAGGDEPPECSAPEDCAHLEAECSSGTCEGGACVLVHLASGTAVPTQVAGDCYRRVCDGQGSAVETYDVLDTAPDGNDCTSDGCSAAGPVYAPVARGTACNTGAGVICDGQGACLDHLPVVCEIPNGNTYTCPGTDGVNGTMCVATDQFFNCWHKLQFLDGNVLVSCYPIEGAGYPWCPPGTPCTVDRHDPWPDVVGVCQ